LDGDGAIKLANSLIAECPFVAAVSDRYISAYIDFEKAIVLSIKCVAIFYRKKFEPKCCIFIWNVRSVYNTFAFQILVSLKHLGNEWMPPCLKKN
jgi:hypothetical protein